MASKPQDTALEETKTAEVPKKEIKTTAKEEKKIMYIGPTVITYGLNKNTIYEELTAGVKDLIEKNKLLGKLFIDITDSNLSKKVANTSIQGTIEYIACEKIKGVNNE